MTFNFLLVDAEKSFVEKTSHLLQEKGFTVTSAFSGLEALTLLEHDKTIDIVVIDSNTPDLQEMNIIATLKNKHPLVEIIILTGDPTFRSAIEAMKSGAFDYLIKPCDLNHLIFTAQKAFIRKKEREAKILDARMKPFISNRERRALISSILES